RRLRSARQDGHPHYAHHGDRRAPRRAHRDHRQGASDRRRLARGVAGTKRRRGRNPRIRVPRTRRAAVRVGSLPWLLRHEIRVRWRELIGDTSPTLVILLGLGVLFIAHLILLEVVGSLIGDLSGPLPAEAVFLAGLLGL